MDWKFEKHKTGNLCVNGRANAADVIPIVTAYVDDQKNLIIDHCSEAGDLEPIIKVPLSLIVDLMSRAEVR